MKKGDLRKKEILETSEYLFCKNGYAQTSIQDILDRLKISKGSFYHHYLSKESLLEEICKKRAEEIFDTAQNDILETDNAVNNINRLLSDMIPFRDQKISFLMMLLPIFRLPEGRLIRMSYCNALSFLFYQDISRQLLIGHSSGELVCHDPDITAEIIFSMIHHFWIKICDIILEAEAVGASADVAECLRITDTYRHHIEHIICLPYGSVTLIDIRILDYIIKQIHSHRILQMK